jgi:hypothetical protein
MKYNDQQEKFEDIKGVIRTVNHYRSDYPCDIFKLYLLVIALPVM